jgi:hypothetical protein
MMGKRLILWTVLLLGSLGAVFVLYPRGGKIQPVDGSLPDRAMPERQNKFINLRLRKIERQGEKVLLTPLQILGFDTGAAQGSDKPLLASVGSSFRFLKASPRLTYVVQGIEADGVVIGFGDSADKIAGSTKLFWK